MPPPSPLTLIHFEPAWDLLALFALTGPSLGPTRIESVRWPSHRACSSSSFDSNSLPCVYSPSHNAYFPHRSVHSLLKRDFFDIDAGLGKESVADSEAFKSLIRGDLNVCVKIGRFVDEEHWRMVYSKILIRAVPWPFGRAYARIARRKELLGIEEAAGVPREGRVGWAKNRARTIYKALAEKMGNEEWLLKSKDPTSLDAEFFGHVAQARFQPGLAEALEEFPTLQAHYERVLARVRKSNLFNTSVVESASSQACAFPGPKLDLPFIKTIPTSAARKDVHGLEGAAHASVKMDDAMHPSLASNVMESVAFGMLTLVTYVLWKNMVAVSIQDSVDAGVDEE